MRGRERAGNTRRGYAASAGQQSRQRLRRAGPRAVALTLVLALSGCTTPPVATPEATPTPEPSPEVTFSPVYTDWSKLEPYVPEDREEVYVRYWGESRFTLTPSPDYGTLITFRGAAITGHIVGWDLEEWGGDAYYSMTDRLYGLMTLDGKVVVDPVYNDVTGIVVKDETGRYDTFPGAKVYTQYAADSPTRYRYTISATDGSWTTGPVFIALSDTIGDEYEPYFGYYGYDGEALFALREDGYLMLLDPYTGQEKFAQPLPEYQDISAFSADLGEDLVTLSYTINTPDGYTTHLLCWDLAGNSVALPPEVNILWPYSEGLAAARTDSGWGYIDRDGRWIISPQYTYAYSFENGHALVENSGEGYFFINPRGKPLTDPINTDHAQRTGEYWIFTGYKWDAGLVLDGNLQPVNSPLLHRGYVSVMDYGWAIVSTDNGILLVKGTDSWPIPDGFYLYSNPMNVREHSVLLTRDSEFGYETWRWTPAAGELTTLPSNDPDNNHFSQDPITGKAYRRILGDSYNTIEIQDADGKTLFRAEDCENFYGDSRPTLAGGNCLCQSYDDDTPTVLLSPNGEVLMKKYWDNGLD